MNSFLSTQDNTWNMVAIEISDEDEVQCDRNYSIEENNMKTNMLVDPCFPKKHTSMEGQQGKVDGIHIQVFYICFRPY